MNANAYFAGNDSFRSARDRCIAACLAYNDKAEKVSPKERGALWLKIVSPNEAPKPLTTAEQMFNDPSLKPQVPFVKVPVFMDYGLRVHIGGSTFINRGFKVLDSPVADVTIGEGCLFGPDVTIISVSHPLRAEDRAEAKTGRPASYGKPVQVGDDVWVGARVIILPGVTIGPGSVIAARSVITRDIPAKSLAVGSPARIVRSLEKEKTLEFAAVASTLEEALNLD